MKRFLLIVIVILLLQRCTAKVEIPNNHAGVVKDQEQVETQVLKAGEHLISFGSEVIIYDISRVSLETEFGFLFKDVSEGNLKVAIEFKPVIDSLSGFYRKYQSLYVTPVVEIETRSIVRNLLKDYNSNELTKEELEQKIIKAAFENNLILNYVDVYEVNIVELRF